MQRSSAGWALLAAAPIAIAGGFALLAAMPGTRDEMFLLREENHLVEFLTFACLLLGGILAALLARRIWVRREGTVLTGYYALFAAGLLVTAMEEVAWTQAFFHFDTPFGWGDINRQGELTLHNLPVLHGHNDNLRLAFGIGGLVGVALRRNRRFWRLGAPPVLMPWFLTISLASGLDLYRKHATFGVDGDAVVTMLSEVVELLIGAAAVIYIWLNGRRLREAKVQPAERIAARNASP